MVTCFPKLGTQNRLSFSLYCVLSFLLGSFTFSCRKKYFLMERGIVKQEERKEERWRVAS